MKEIVVVVDADLEDLIPVFLENRKEDIRTIRTLLTNGDLGEISRLGHNMKGSGAGYGFEKITEIGKDIEIACKDGNRAQVEQLNNDLESYLSEIKIIYEELF